MQTLDDTEISILLMLAEEAVDTGRRVRPETVAANFRPPLSVRVVELSLRHLRDGGLLEASFDNPRDFGYSISRQGLSLVDRLYERQDISGRTEWRPKGQNDVRATGGTVTLDLSSLPSHDSKSWTGLPSDFDLGEDLRLRLVDALRHVERDIDGLELSNSEKSQIRALVVASKVLADSPEPPADLIWEMINRASQIAGIASLFVSVIALFASVSQ